MLYWLGKWVFRPWNSALTRIYGHLTCKGLQHEQLPGQKGKLYLKIQGWHL